MATNSPDLFDQWLDPNFDPEPVAESTYNPDRWGVCNITGAAGARVYALLLTAGGFATEEMIDARGWDVYTGCKVAAERVARRWPLGHVCTVRMA